MSKVSLRKVNKIYGRGADQVHAVQDLSLDMRTVNLLLCSAHPAAARHQP